MGCLLWLKSYSQIHARPADAARWRPALPALRRPPHAGRPGGKTSLAPETAAKAARAAPQTMRMLNSGRPSTCATITSPRTTGPTFSGVPE